MGDFKLRWVILARASMGAHLMGHFKINGQFQYDRWVILTQQWVVLIRPMGDFTTIMGNFSVPNGAQ